MFFVFSYCAALVYLFSNSYSVKYAEMGSARGGRGGTSQISKILGGSATGQEGGSRGGGRGDYPKNAVFGLEIGENSRRSFAQRK